MELSMIRKCTACEQENELPPERLMAAANCGGCAAALAPPSEPLVADESNLDAVIEGTDLPVLVDFWAPWCGPCRAISPIVEELAGEYDGKLKVVKMNVDDNPPTPAKYGVRGIPNLIVFTGGTVHEQIVGAVPKAKLAAAIDSAVA